MTFYPTYFGNYLVWDDWVWAGRLDWMPDLLAAKFNEVSPIFLGKALWKLFLFLKIQLQLSSQRNGFQWSIAALYNQKIQL